MISISTIASELVIAVPSSGGVEEVGQTDSDYNRDKKQESLERSHSEKN